MVFVEDDDDVFPFFCFKEVRVALTVDSTSISMVGAAATLSRITVSITSLSSPHRSRLYHSTCLLVSGTSTVSSLLEGSDIATWSLTLLSMNTPNSRLALLNSRESTRPFTKSKPVSKRSAVAGVNTSCARK